MQDIKRIVNHANPERKALIKRVCDVQYEPHRDIEALKQFIDMLETEVDPAIRERWSGYFRSLMGEFRKKE